MDYKYIEQLLERYFQCETSLQEEQILRAFFAQDDVPEALAEYVPMFRAISEAGEDALSDAFDQKMLALIAEEDKTDEPEAKVVMLNPQAGDERRPSLFAPFLRAAAIVACVLTIGGAAETAISTGQDEQGEPSATVNPYIRQADINQTIRVKDVNQAEHRVQVDSVGILEN